MRRALIPILLVVAAGLAACSSTDTKGAIDVTATNSACKVARTDLPAGKSTFSVQNDGDDVTEVYVYGKGDEVKGEVENIGPGTSRDLAVDLVAGKYEVACKPGMKGDGIRTAITVTGSGGTKAATPTRTATITAIDYEYQGLDGLAFEKGDVVEFRLKNDAPSEKHELEVFGPGGKALGEVGPTKPGTTGTVVIALDRPGTYRLNCGIKNHAAMGMKATFTVT
jgi:uncharacterized cupredoxin-like copper-binding protein